MEAIVDIARFFINPVFYIALLIAVLLGYLRVKKERKVFRTRILPGGTELAELIKGGLKMGLFFSILIIALGLTVPIEWLVALSIASLLMMISGFYRIGSFVYMSLAAVALGWLFRTNDWSVSLFAVDYNGYYVAWEWLFPVALITAAFLYGEGKLIGKYGAEAASPRLNQSSRGLPAVSYEAKRLWLIPVLLLVPGELIESFAPYWPQLPIGESSFSLILFPVVLGFQSRSRHTLPVYLYPRIGKAVKTLGVMMAVLALASILWGPAAFVALIFGVVSRLAVSLYFAAGERRGVFAVTPQPEGVMIADVLPGSPAAKMGLAKGEVIKKVNGLTVSNESELYEAIQVNAAHCRLEVLDHNREVRLRQHVIFRHDHHRLGLVVVN
ncbi:PDZ domain-containing protein [Planococcus salinus]|uniref:PDZ domain-containing protein n=1 Tax=Planococcus salinus TaxID=1848460 RepID=A0A3M8P338_9BACL|nr:PDZ domain-containing protein [Planococcus salinus]RNF38149.1 PDZ domain-containing protein [Planococcus salinus]